ncbi:MAG TPA: glutathione binding-like protein [Sphingorhabdus sp.]|jgi:glutathione S-transferase|nr:glutathione binding-like protein [Sphingorhabdus sp.]
MKLYYLPGACSMASHIVMNEIGKSVTLVKVDLQSQTTDEGEDYRKVSPNGYVPALQLADGNILTENIALLTYLAEGHDAGELALPDGRLAKAKVLSLLSFLTSELHKSYSPFFQQSPLEGAEKDAAIAKVEKRIAYVDSLLDDGRPYLTGENFSIADAYAFTILNWSGMVGVSLEKWPRVGQLMQRIGHRSAVQKAMLAEGLIEQAA